MLQVKVPPAGEVTAFKVADCPVQMVASLTVTVGTGATVVVIDDVLLQPWAFVTVTVKVPAVVIEAFAFVPRPLSQE